MPSLAPEDAQIRVEGVEQRFGSTTALHDLSLTIYRGQIAVIVGGSGAGKTTLLRLLIGLDKPTRGSIFIDGEDIVPLGDQKMNIVRRKFGMVFQYAALLDSMTVLDNVAFPLREHTKLKVREVREKVAQRLELLELSGTEQRYPSELSGGMRKRVALARALMLDPAIVVYDEPTSGLDPITSRLVDDLIIETNRRFNVTSVVITHDMASALRIAHRIYLLAQGNIVTEGTPKEFASSHHDLARKFLDSSGVALERAASSNLTKL
ncbi:MAG TPA: ABC transporter ATP-binding protein [Polyangiaceae bacterium]|nr:ABC transporter ATP-binding protein [Polyangiaceae bacterium]